MFSKRLLRSSHLLRQIPNRSTFSTSRILREQPIYQPPTPPSSSSGSPSNPHRDFYKSFGRPIVKVFLGALFTYQVLFYIWSRLEAIEEKEEKEGELKRLETELKGLDAKRKEIGAEAGKVVGKVEEKVQEEVQKGRSWFSGWFGGK